MVSQYQYIKLLLMTSLQNFPLYIRTVTPQNETDLQFQYLVHISIDVIEEKSKYIYMYMCMHVVCALSYGLPIVRHVCINSPTS